MDALEIKKNGGKIFLKGFITENSDLSFLESLSGEVIINFKDVTRINSCGIRDWVVGISKAKIDKLIFEDCPVIIIKQINAVPAFQGACKITSFYSPFYCDACDKEETVLIKTDTLGGNVDIKQKCPSCGGEMQLDVIPKQYFKFISRA